MHDKNRSARLLARPSQSPMRFLACLAFFVASWTYIEAAPGSREVRKRANVVRDLQEAAYPYAGGRGRRLGSRTTRALRPRQSMAMPCDSGYGRLTSDGPCVNCNDNVSVTLGSQSAPDDSHQNYPNGYYSGTCGFNVSVNVQSGSILAITCSVLCSNVPWVARFGADCLGTLSSC